MKRSQGVTAVELMAVLLFVAILMGMGVSSLHRMQVKHSIRAQSQALLQTIHFARVAALKERQPVTICPADGVSVSPMQCATHGDWSQGWFVFVDTGRVDHVDGHDRVLKVYQASSRSTTALASRRQGIRFQANGIGVANMNRIRFASRHHPQDLSLVNMICIAYTGRAQRYDAITSEQQGCSA